MGFNYYPYRDEDGHVRGLLCIAYDLTEQQKIKEALVHSEDKYRGMMEAMTDPVCICSSDYRIEYMNPAMMEIAEQDATGLHCHKALHFLDEKCPWCIHEKVVRGCHAVVEIKSPRNGRFYHVSSSPVFKRDGIVSSLTIFRDITEMKQLESSLQQTSKMEAIGTLAGGIAHDFNNILVPIMGYTEMLIDIVSDDSAQQEFLHEIYKAGKRAKELVAQILTFSRKGDESMEPLTVHSIVKESLKLLAFSLPATIRIDHSISSECDPVVANPTQIHQIVMNLATNAYHAMEENGGTLTVTLEQITISDGNNFPDLVNGEYLLLKVSDTGKGISGDLLDKVFQPYFTTKSQGKGTGLGLSVVHGIVELCRGKIKIESREGSGTDVYVYLPTADFKHEASKKYPVQKVRKLIQGGTERVLIVDDNKAVLQMEIRLLESLGYQVTACDTPLKALEVFKEEPEGFDLILTDFTMPDMTGDRLALELTAIRPDLPVIICTGNTFSDGDEIETAGANGILVKPFNKADLASMIHRILDKERPRRESLIPKQ
ncbi:Histidine kinase [Desulfamplus magnetovallimortis]|uniref:histidine kinase n=2 Tax=Desulfamplus magnetovallimortis TaxID=1246637 RepID=A0A1W1HH98_9BACT|nr:Histidine kinase [Desulfamplus magnetovallimortis]